MAHLVRADFGIPHIVNEGRLDGWFPRFVLGHQEFLFNGPGLTWAMALVRGLTFGALSNTGALKAVTIASFVAVPPAVWFLARSFGLTRRGAGFAAVVTLVVSGPYGPGLHGTFQVGLISHQLGAVLFLLAFGALVRLFGDPRPRWVLLAAAGLAGLLVTHVISVLILGVMLAVFLAGRALTRRLSWGALRRLTTAGVLTVGLAGFWLVPAVAHRDLRGYVTTWGTPPVLDRLGDILRGDVLLPAGVMVAVVAAAIWCVVRNHPLALCAVLPAAYLAVAHGLPHLIGHNEATLQLANRGLGYAGLVAILPLAAVLADRAGRFPHRVELGVLVGCAVVAVAVAPGRGHADQKRDPVPALRHAAAELARLVPDGARFATERDFPAEVRRTRVIHPEIWLARYSGRNTLNGFNVESSTTPRASVEPYRLEERSPAASARTLARLGVSHVVTTGTKLAKQLASSDAYTLEWQEPPVSIFRVGAREGNPPPATLLSSLDPFEGRLLKADPEHLVLEVTAAEPLSVTLAVARSPKWHGRLLDERGDRRGDLPLDHTTDNLLRVDLPAGTTRFAVVFESDAWARLGVALSLLTIAGLAGWKVVTRRPKTPS